MSQQFKLGCPKWTTPHGCAWALRVLWVLCGYSIKEKGGEINLQPA